MLFVPPPPDPAILCAAGPLAFRELQRRSAADPLVGILCARMLDQPRQREFLRAQALERLGLHRALDSGDASLIRQVALRDPSVALREIDRLLPGHAALLAEVIASIPGEAVGLMAGNSPAAERLREFLGPDSELVRLARETSLDVATRQRLAWTGGALAAKEVQNDRAYFRVLVSQQRLHALEPFARQFVRGLSPGETPPNWTAPELYLLAVYGRAEISKPLFVRLFDRIGADAPALDWPMQLEYLADASIHGRIRQIPLPRLAAALEQVNSARQMVLAGEVLDGLPANTARTLAGRLASRSVYLGLLAARYGAPSPYARFLQPPARYRPPVRSLQRYYFYDDEDGDISFRAFRAAYRGDPRWKWEESAASVRVWAQRGARRVEIYANKPGFAEVELPLPGKPDVLVHRGHTYFLDRTLRRLTDETRLVFLGACRGMESVAEVLHNASQAQMFATRGVGSHTINDPLLKQLNVRLLTSANEVDWVLFWREARTKLGRNPLFAAYVPPDQNTSAIVLRAWYRYLLESSGSE